MWLNLPHHGHRFTGSGKLWLRRPGLHFDRATKDGHERRQGYRRDSMSPINAAPQT
jgi:hypothetical protein